MKTIRLPARPSFEDWERLCWLLRLGKAVLVLSEDGDIRSLRLALARHGFLDVVDGGDAGLEVHPAEASEVAA